MNNKYLLSVITVAKNSDKHIEDCIKSVIAQKFQKLEYIIIDGNSTDKTLKIVKKYKRFINVVISEQDKGIYDAMNKGLNLAKGKFVHFLNSDDKYNNSNVLKTIFKNIKHEEIYFGKIIYIENGKKKVLGSKFELKKELISSNVPQPSLFVPLSFYKKVGNFNDKFRIAADYDMLLRLARYYKINYLPISVTIMNYGGLSYQKPFLTFFEAMKVSISNGASIYLSLLYFILKCVNWTIKKILFKKIKL